jgi:hypothetical protein
MRVPTHILRLEAERLLEEFKRRLDVPIRERWVDIHAGLTRTYPAAAGGSGFGLLLPTRAPSRSGSRRSIVIAAHTLSQRHA